MAKYVFLYRLANSDDRDACAYIETKNGPARFECGHYFGGIILHGACYCGSTPANYDDIETVLTADEYAQLWQLDKELDALGYGIKEGDERYKKGLEICDKLQPIIDRLKSDEAQQFFADIVADEKERVAEEYDLSEEEVDEIFKEFNGMYWLGYQDRAIISYVWNDVDELAEEWADSCMDIPEHLERYIDYNQIAKDLMEESRYYELSDGRIVEFAE